MSAYEILDELRDITGCPEGKSITQHVAALRAQVEELKAVNDDIRSATMDYTHEIDKLTARATSAEAERDTFEQMFTALCDEIGCAHDNEAALIAAHGLKARVEKLERVREAAAWYRETRDLWAWLFSDDSEHAGSAHNERTETSINAAFALDAALAECEEGE